jgi:hypothetical protein
MSWVKNLYLGSYYYLHSFTKASGLASGIVIIFINFTYLSPELKLNSRL